MDLELHPTLFLELVSKNLRINLPGKTIDYKYIMGIGNFLNTCYAKMYEF